MNYGDTKRREYIIKNIIETVSDQLIVIRQL